MESCTKSSFNPKINEKFKSTNQEGVFYLYNSNKFLIGTSLLLVELFFLNPHHVLAATNQDRTNVEREFIDNEDILHSNDNILIDEPANKQTSEDDESTSFYLNDLIFIVDGNVLKDSERLKIIKEHYINREVDLKTLRGCVYEVTNYYRTHGYPAATAYLPPPRE